jgi:hypothetical protein
MSDAIVRLKVESQEYDQKLKRATEGLTRYAYECRKVGGTLEVVEKETLDYVKALGQMGTVADALAQGHQFGRVYIGFGTNEMGWPYYDSFIQLYGRLVDTIRQYSPNAKIYCESILPVTASRELQGDAINNTNVKALNELIQKFAAEKGCEYLTCDKAVMGDDGKLPEEASTDGIHLSIEYCKYWLNYIIDET